MRRLVPLAVASLLTLALSGPALAAPGSSGDHAVMYYLSLGDSLAAGQQPIGDPANNHVTDDGYADQLFTIAQATYPKLRHVKLGCSGETTTSFVTGFHPSGEASKCAYTHGSQLDEAVHFLRAHRKFVAFVTIDLGWNDFPCQDSPACIPPGLATIEANLPGILDTLQEAAGPDVPIVGASIYDPFLAYWLIGRPDLAELSVAVLAGPGGLNDRISAIYAARGMPVADVEGAFNTELWEPLVPLPGYPVMVPLNVATLCAYTWECAPAPYGPDHHANHDGYHAMALAFAAKLGL